MDKNQKQALAILGGVATALFLAKRMNPFSIGSYNEDDEENQYEKALRMMRQRKKANAQRNDRIEHINVEKAKESLDDALGYSTGYIESADDNLSQPNYYSDWRAQTMYWDNVDTSGRWKKHMDLSWHTEDDE